MNIKQVIRIVVILLCVVALYYLVITLARSVSADEGVQPRPQSSALTAEAIVSVPAVPTPAGPLPSPIF